MHDFLIDAVGGPDRLKHIADYVAGERADHGGLFSPFELFSIGPTAYSQQMLDRVVAAIAAHRDGGKKVPRDLVRQQATWERAVATARYRDRLAAERAAVWPGCVCLGFGGRFPKDGLVIYTPDGRPLTDLETETYRDICPCPIGQDRVAAIASAKQRLLVDDRARRQTRLWRDMREPVVPAGASLDTHPDRVKIGLVRRWYAGDFKPGLLIAGENQYGKTVTAYLLAAQAIADDLGVLAFNTPDLWDRLRETFTHDRKLAADPDQPPQVTHRTLIEALQSVAFLVLDDLGAEKMTDYVEMALYQVLNARSDRRLRTIITTNLPKAKLADLVGPRVFSRISNLCDRVVFQDFVVGPARDGLVDLEDLTA